VKSFAQLVALGSVDALAQDPDVKGIYTWAASDGIKVQTAAIVLAMRQVERTTERLDKANARLQRWALALAIGSLAVSVTALVVATVAT
jgi:hypothetical protein